MIRALDQPEDPSLAGVSSPVSGRPANAPPFLQELAQTFMRRYGSVGFAEFTALVTPSREKAPSRTPPGFGPRPPGALGALITAAARREGVPPALLSALVQVESGYEPRAVSPVGAKGLTQLMDATARSLGVTDPFDPWQNLVGGARFLHELIGRYSGNLSLALAAYNAGPGAVEAAGNRIPPYAETQAYVRRVMAIYTRETARSGGSA